MAMEDCQFIRHSPASGVYYRAYHDWARKAIFKIKVLRWLEKAILRLVCANRVFHKNAVLPISDAELTESVLDIFSYPDSTKGPTLVGPEE